MNKIILIIAAVLISGVASAADSMADLSKRANDAAQVLRDGQVTSDRAIPRQLLQKAVCVATFPGVIRAAFIFGGQVGQGIVSCRVGGGWSSPTFLTIAAGSWGFQIGVDSTDLVLVFVNSGAIHKVTTSKLELGAGATVTAGPLGRDATLGTDITLKSEIYSYSHSRGLFAGISVAGSVLAVDHDANTMLYGRDAKEDSLLMANYNTSPQAVWPYVQALMSIAR